MGEFHQEFLPRDWDLPEDIRGRLGSQAGRQRLMDEAGHLLLVLHRVPRPEDDAVRQPVLFWRNPGGEWRSSCAGDGMAALEEHLASYRVMLRKLDDDSDGGRSPRDLFQVMRALNPVLRSTRNLHAVLQQARSARPGERRLILLRDQAVELERAAELLAADTRAAMDFMLAEAGEAQTREARRLNRMAAFFFPLATLVAVFGMNEPTQVLAMPGFWVVVVIGVAAGYLLGRARGKE